MAPVLYPVRKRSPPIRPTRNCASMQGTQVTLKKKSVSCPAGDQNCGQLGSGHVFFLIFFPIIFFGYCKENNKFFFLGGGGGGGRKKKKKLT